MVAAPLAKATPALWATAWMAFAVAGCEALLDIRDGRVATCDDQLVNVHETGVDCGGDDCPQCPVGGACRRDADCESGRCLDGICNPTICSDGVLNGNESDVDCGGSCDKCLPGQVCGQDEDCARGPLDHLWGATSGYCRGGVCVTMCDNGKLDNSETDVDCGGSLCVPCDIGSLCGEGADCTSGFCESGICASAP
jgi:hypothetical protein